MVEINITSMAWGMLGAGIVFILGLIITWFWVFPWAATRWLNKASTPGTKQHVMLFNMTGALIELFMARIPELIKDDGKGNLTIHPELKKIGSALIWLAGKQGQQLVGKILGGVDTKLNNINDIMSLDGLSQMGSMPDMETLSKAVGEKTAAKIQLGIQLLPLVQLLKGGGPQSGQPPPLGGGGTVISR